MKKLFAKILFIVLILCLLMVSASCVQSQGNNNGGSNSETDVFTVKWLDEDGTELKTTTVAKNFFPVYGDDPVKQETEKYIYTFSGWNPAIVVATQDATYTATYTSTLRTYTAVYVFGNGTENAIKEYEYGNTAEIPAVPEKCGYDFVGWYLAEEEYDFETEITCDITLTAKWSIKENVVLVNTINSRIKTYLDDSYKNIDNYVSSYSGNSGDYSKPSPVVFDWTDMLEGRTYPDYTLYIGEDENFDISLAYTTMETSYEIYNLFVRSCYYWKVTAMGWESGVNIILTDYISPRLIDLEGVTNMRDIGGYVTADGIVTAQGLIYRSARLDSISEQGKTTAKEILGIKTEIDLRRIEDGALNNYGMGAGFLGDGVQYCLCSMNWSYTSPDNASSVRRVFEILSDINNYPVVFHCTAGADRTGFIGYLINGLLGVCQEDLYDDYQLTNFAAQSERGRYYNTISSYVDAINAENGSKLSERVYNYLVNKKGVKREYLDSLITIMTAGDNVRGYISFVNSRVLPVDEYADLEKAILFDSETVDVDISVGAVLSLPEGHGITSEATVTIADKSVEFVVNGNALFIYKDTLKDLGLFGKQIIVIVGDKYYKGSVLLITKIITTVEELKNLYTYTDYTETVATGSGNNGGGTFYNYGGYFVLGNDIDCEGEIFSAACGAAVQNSLNITYQVQSGGFYGTFDGRGHEIQHAMFWVGGLFGEVGQATIKDVRFVNAGVLYAWGVTNGILGQNITQALITDCYFDVKLVNYPNSNNWTNASSVLAGWTYYGARITNCEFILNDSGLPLIRNHGGTWNGIQGPEILTNVIIDRVLQEDTETIYNDKN